MIEYVILAYCNEGFKDGATDQSPNVESQNREHSVSGEHGQSSESNLRKKIRPDNQGTDLSLSLSQPNHKRVLELGGSGDLLSSTLQEESIHTRHAEWAKVFEAATQRRTEVLTPENLENMWTIGRNYKKKLQKKAASGSQAAEITGSVASTFPTKGLVIEVQKQKPETYIRIEDKVSLQLPPRPQQDTRPTDLIINPLSSSQKLNEEVFPKGGSTSHELDKTASVVSHENWNRLKRSNSTSDLKVHSKTEDMFVSKDSTPFINEYYSADINKLNVQSLMSSSDMVIRREGQHVPKLRCRVQPLILYSLHNLTGFNLVVCVSK